MGKSKQNIHIAAWAMDLWEQISAAEGEVRIHYDTRSKAVAARFALYTARTTNRELMKTAYAEDDPAYGTSPWDGFRLTIELDQKTNDWVLLITRHSDAQFVPTRIEGL